MRSRSSNTEGSAPKHFPRHSKFPTLQDMKHREQEKDPSSETDGVLPHPTPEKSHTGKGHQAEDLSRDDLLFLLSILEGELQARDEVIGILRAEKMDLASLEAQYGFVTPKKVLEALQRDAFQAKSAPWQEDIYEKPMNELDKVIEKHKDSHRRILEQLLMVEKSHRQTIMEMEEEKKKHKEYMERSDEFINLLEQECERAGNLFNFDLLCISINSVDIPTTQKDIRPLRTTLSAKSISTCARVTLLTLNSNNQNNAGK